MQWSSFGLTIPKSNLQETRVRLFLAILSLNLAICLPATAQPSQPVSEFDITAEQSAVCSAGKRYAE